MSQLSFADFFNMTRETADNPPVIQVRPQVAEVVPSVQQMMSEQHSRSRFIRVFKDTGRHLGRWEVFRISCHWPPVSWIWPASERRKALSTAGKSARVMRRQISRTCRRCSA